MPKTILIAPDKFKGSLSAEEVGRAIVEGLSEAGQNFNYHVVPMADGGEGTCDILTRFSGGKKIMVKARDPLFREIETYYGISGDGKTAFIEMAAASGLRLLKADEHDPLKATTWGTGQLIADALNRNVESVILGIGGSATNDGGTGMAAALGAVFYTHDKKIVSPVGENLIHIKHIDKDKLHYRLNEVEVIALCDVANPLHGPTGAAYVFATQKGADSHAVIILDDGLKNFASIVKNQFDIDINFPGAGAGGGIAGGAKAFFRVQFKPGVDYVMTLTEMEKLVRQSDVVITGEGKLDQQTLSGKVIKGVAQLCRRFQKPFYVVAGKNELSDHELKSLAVSGVVSLINDRITEREAMENAFLILKQRVKEELAAWIG